MWENMVAVWSIQDIVLLVDVSHGMSHGIPGSGGDRTTASEFAALVVGAIPLRSGGGSRVGMVTFGAAEQEVGTAVDFTSSIQLASTQSLSTAIKAAGAAAAAAAVPAMARPTQLGAAFARAAQDLFADQVQDGTAPPRRDPIVLVLLLCVTASLLFI